MLPAAQAAAVAAYFQNNEELRVVRIEKRLLRDLLDPFRLPSRYFRQHYRLPKYLAMELIEMLRPFVPEQRRSAIPFNLQVLGVIRFLAEGAFQKGAASDYNHPMSQASMSRCIDRILDAFLAIERRFIKFPSNMQERQDVEAGFQDTIRIPSILGLIDCFLVACIRPTRNEESYYNYKAGPSLNIQMVADANHNILNLCISAGSNTDRFIWNISDMKDYMEYLRSDDAIFEAEGSYYLLGDSGYTPSPVLLTPILGALEGSPEDIYTTEHVRTCCGVEQTIGIITNSWLAIKRARKLYYQPEKCCKIITACGVLHNFLNSRGVRYEIDEMDDDLEFYDEENYDYQAGTNFVYAK